ncbi:MAG: GSU3473 family protein [Desulfuromonadales bacterium]
MPDPRTGQQLIHVITRDGTYQHLTSSALDILLEKNRLLKFRRSSGWVTVGIDPIRVKDRREASRPYQGPDKRSAF